MKKFTYNKTLLPNNYSEIESLEKILSFIEQFQKIQDNQLEPAFSIAKIVYSEMQLGTKAYLTTIMYVLLMFKDIPQEQITSELGDEISEIYADLQKISSIPTDKYDKHLDNFIKLLLTASKNLQVIFIILAEQIYFMRNITFFSAEEQEIITKNINDLYLQIAHRLGLYRIKTELEELIMKYYHLDIYKSIQEKLTNKKIERDEYIENFITPIKQILRENGYRYEVQGRTKSISSIWKKMKRQAVPFSKVYDLFAIRIIIDINEKQAEKAIWNIFSLITEKYKSHTSRIRDWISKPKANGYSSLHVTVLGPENNWIEIQIRTKLMHEIAENGLAAHWKYKEYKEKEANKEDIYSLIKTSLKQSVSKKKNIIKKTFYSDEIFVFTPNGDIKKLQKGSTILDFAFSIHTSIGAKCVGAKVNNKYLSYKNELQNGDSVKIVTSKRQKPKYLWLKIAQNNSVRKKILQLLKQQEFDLAKLGKEILQRKFKRLDIEFSDLYLNKLEKHYKCNKKNELFQNFGEGKYDVKNIKSILFATQTKQESEKEFNHEKEIEKKQSKSDNILYIAQNIQSLDYTFAKCCNPIPGDKIYAFISINRGAIIHRNNCPNTNNLLSKYPYRIIKAKWKEEIIDFEKQIKILILGKDRVGIVNTITDIISNKQNIKMISINIEVDKKNNFRGYVTIKISDKKKLNLLIERLLKIKDVYKVVRY